MIYGKLLPCEYTVIQRLGYQAFMLGQNGSLGFSPHVKGFCYPATLKKSITWMNKMDGYAYSKMANGAGWTKKERL
jgi:hypothetical protein